MSTMSPFYGYSAVFGRSFSHKHWPYQIDMSMSNRVEDAERWCWARFKGRVWNNYNYCFVFKHEADALLFKLTWA